MEYHLDKIVTREVNVEVLPEQVHAWLFAVRAGPGKAAPAKSLALGQHGNSRPLRLYPDVMRQSPMLYSDTLIKLYSAIYFVVPLATCWLFACLLLLSMIFWLNQNVIEYYERINIRPSLIVIY